MLGTMMLIAKMTSGTNREYQQYLFSDGDVYAEIFQGGGAVAFDTTPPGTPEGKYVAGVPACLVSAYDAASLQVYLNGNLLSTDASLTGSLVRDTTSVLRLGARVFAPNYFVDGVLGPQAVYNTKLGADTIKAIWQAGIRGGVSY